MCGITNRADALAAAESGAHAVGFIFYQESPRYVPPETVKEIVGILPPETISVGVFVNCRAKRIEEIKSFCRLDMIQLHGDETPGFCLNFPSFSVIKAGFPRTLEDVEDLVRYPVGALLIDGRTKNLYGGTGTRPDWELARIVGTRRPLILAGGLAVKNIADAVSIVSPSAVDINSGCEIAPGIKDHATMREIILIIKNMCRNDGRAGPVFRKMSNCKRTMRIPSDERVELQRKKGNQL